METKETFNWKRLLITTAIVLLAATATGGTTYYVLNQNFQKERDANQIALDDVRAEVKKTTQTSSTTTSSNTPAPTTTNIRTVNFAKVITKDSSMGSWQANQYADLNGDGNEEALLGFIYDGTGHILDFYIYGYQNGQLREQYKKEGLYKGDVAITGSNVYANSVDLDSAVNVDKPNSDVVKDVHKKYTWNGTTFVESNL